MRWWDRCERFLCITLLAAIVLLVFLAALMRTLGVPVIWSVDVAQLLFAWLIMLAANQTFRHGEHASVDIVLRRLSAHVRRRLLTVFDVAMLVVLGIIFWFGIALFNLNPQRTLGSTDIPYQYVTLALPIGALLMMITLLHRIVGNVKHQQSETGI